MGRCGEGQVEELHDRSVGPWNKLEEVFQGRVARALHRLGVPNQDDIQCLFRQVELLDRMIQDLSQAAEAETKTRRTRVGKDVNPVAPSKLPARCEHRRPVVGNQGNYERASGKTLESGSDPFRILELASD